MKTINEILDLLNNDGVIAIPTDTVYGFACSFHSEKAYKQIYNIKERDQNKPMVALAANIKQIKEICTLDKTSLKLAKHWPSDLTLIVKNKKTNFLKSETIGVRIPDNELILPLLEITGPLFVTSCNISGEPELVKYKDVLSKFPNVEIPFQVNAYGKQPSTVYDCINNKVLRQGSMRINLK